MCCPISRFSFRYFNYSTKKFEYNKGDFPNSVEEFLETMGDLYALEQCTGLKDKNGKWIYEGDIFELEDTSDNVREVVWDQSTASFKVSCRGNEEYWNGLYNENREYEDLVDLTDFLDCAIIGTIHDIEQEN